jgi:hypothetical protein
MTLAKTLKVPFHLIAFALYKTVGTSRRFTFMGRSYRYHYHPYNNTSENERSIEIPIALEFVRHAPPGPVLEIGNVLNHYSPFPHAVVDKYEKGPGIRNVDVADLDAEAPYSCIVSISTMEHVGVDEPRQDPQKSFESIIRTSKMLLPGGTMLVTFPIGHNPALDAAFRENRFPGAERRAMRRLNRRNDWVECDPSQIPPSCPTGRTWYLAILLFHGPRAT